jgi:entry exclusion lipoprotein TrbK
MKKVIFTIIACSCLLLTSCEREVKESFTDPVVSVENCTKEYASKISGLMNRIDFSDKCYINFGMDFNNAGYKDNSVIENKRKEKMGVK